MMTGEQFSQHGFFDSVKNNDSCSKYIVFKELISAMKKRLDFLTSIFQKEQEKWQKKTIHKTLFLDYTAKYPYLDTRALSKL